MKSKLSIIILFAFIGFGCKESKTKEVTNIDKVEIKLENSLNKLKDNNNKVVKKECFKKIGSIKSYENKVAKFKGFSIEAVSKDFRTHFTLKDAESTIVFDTDIVLDMGELYYWAFDSSEKNHIYLLELDNYYSSTFFILMQKDNDLYNLGDISIDQPNAEEGLKKESFKFCHSNDKIIVETFLNKKSQKTKEFVISSEKIVKELIEQNEEILNYSFTVGNIVHSKVETYLNIRSKPNSRGETVAKAYPSNKMKVLEVLDGWLKVDLNGVEGYVSSDYVSQEAP